MSKSKTTTKPKPKAGAKAPAPAPSVRHAEPSVYTMPIGDALADGGNARRRTDRNRATIKASLSRFGAGRSIVLDGRNIVRAGNGTLEQAADAGFSEILVIEPGPGQLVAVKRSDWSPAEARAYGVTDNRAAELAEWDPLALAETARAIQSEADIALDAIGFSEDEIDRLCESLADAIVPEPEPKSSRQKPLVECPDCGHAFRPE